MALNVIDVSRWQPANITDLVDYDGVIIKATEGTGYVSPTCDTQYQKAKARGKLLGVYHFASGGDARAEAEFFIANVKGYVKEAILVLDYEASAVNRGREWVRTWIKRVKELTGVNPLVYASRSVVDAQDLAGLLKEENCGLWLAAYPHTNPTGYYEPKNERGEVIRQYSSSGRLSGYNGNLDLNYAWIDADKWHKYATSDGNAVSPDIPKPATPTRKSDDEIASEVIAGQWGDGDDRRSRLSNAGYDYNAIQNIVNSRLGASSGNTIYTVKTGDTLSGIASKFGTTYQHLAQINGISNPNIIHVGQVIRIDGQAQAPSTTYYTVKRGDTLSGIAAKYGTSWKTLQQLNGITDPNKIYPGQKVRIK